MVSMAVACSFMTTLSRHFENKAIRRQAVLGHDIDDQRWKIRVLEADRPQVHRHAWDMKALTSPFGNLPARFADRPDTNLIDQPAFFRKRNEFSRRDRAQHRIVPTRKCLDTVETAIDRTNLGLIMEM